MKSEIVNIIQETDAVRRYFLNVPKIISSSFTPGQFVMIQFPELTGNENARSYSIASPPNMDGFLELCIVLKPNGMATPLLWGKSIGDVLEISEPQGHFVLPKELNTEVVLICTGTGIAPFRSIVLHALLHDSNRKFTLIFGNRFEKDILYNNEFEQLSREYANFNFFPVLSREENWKGHKGYVHSVYENLFSENKEAFFMVCGWKEMCSEARSRLKSLGFNRRQYLFEDYG